MKNYLEFLLQQVEAIEAEVRGDQPTGDLVTFHEWKQAQEQEAHTPIRPSPPPKPKRGPVNPLRKVKYA